MGRVVTIASSISGVVITELRQIADARGAVLHMAQAGADDGLLIGECYFSEILPGVVKAWKRHRVQTQRLAVPVGRVRFVVFDDRESSTTRGTIDSFELGRPDAYVRLQVPPGLWYGFACLGDTPALLANCPDQRHDPAETETQPLDASLIPFDWNATAPER